MPTSLLDAIGREIAAVDGEYHAPLVIPIGGVEQGDERPCVGEDHGQCLRRMMSASADLARPAGARA